MNIFENIENMFKHLDNIQVFSKTQVQYEIALLQVLEVLDVTIKNNIPFNKAKLQFKVNKVK